MEPRDYELDRFPEDPRTMLADTLREFVLQAVRQQEVNDAVSSGKKAPGSLYKTDGGFLKVHLQAPAADHVFGAKGGEHDIPSEALPPVWVLIPLKAEAELDELILESDDILVHVRPEGQQSLQFMVRDDYLGPLAPAFDTLEQMQAYTPPDDAEQIETAKNWTIMLESYDIRTIVGTNQGQADVA